MEIVQEPPDLHDQEPDQNNQDEDSIKPYFIGNKGKCITSSNAQNILNRYESSLSKNFAYVFKITYTYNKMEPSMLYICKMKFPEISPLKETITGDEMLSKRLSKKNCEMKACILLYEIGEINDDLNPITMSYPSEKAKRKREEEKEIIKSNPISIYLKENASEIVKGVYLNCIHLDSKENDRERKLNPAEIKRGFGILCREKLPIMNSFPVLSPDGNFTVTIQAEILRLQLCKDQVKMTQNFHQFLFSKVLEITEGKVYHPTRAPSSYFVVPIKKEDVTQDSCIDWELMKTADEKLDNKSYFWSLTNILPRVLYTLNSLLLAEEIREAITPVFFMETEFVKTDGALPLFHLETNNKSIEENLDDVGEKDKKDTCRYKGPDTYSILEALSPKTTNENLGSLGDAFLKFILTVILFTKYKCYDEGELTTVRIDIIKQLKNNSKVKSLKNYIVSIPFTSKNDWDPPCYIRSNDFVISNKIGDKCKKRKTELELMTVQDTNQGIEIKVGKTTVHSAKALIATYLLACGEHGALSVMKWLQIDDEHDYLDTDYKKWPPILPNPIILETCDITSKLETMKKDFKQFELSHLRYRFKDIFYLLQSLTHPSYNKNCITYHYERLELLGDSVLDYIIAIQLHKYSSVSKKFGKLKQPICSNIFFGCLAAIHNYHQFWKVEDQVKSKMIQLISLLSETEPFQYFQKNKLFYEAVDYKEKEIKVPKMLGDVFEAVAGAIYLDSGCNIKAVWETYGPMINPYMNQLFEVEEKKRLEGTKTCNLYFPNGKLMFPNKEKLSKS